MAGPLSPMSTVAVIGLGTIGSALAESLSRAGLRVVAVETDGPALQRGRARVDRLAGAAPAGDRIEYTTRIGDVAGVELVIEAVPERFETKQAVLRSADAICGPATVFATTTTALSVTRLASVSGRMARTVGLHVVNPATGSGVVELAATPVTDPAVCRDMRDLLVRLGGTPVSVGDRAGFITGGLMMGYLNDAVAMYERRYAGRDDIDSAMTLGCGLPMGPLAQLDLIGLDVAYETLRALYDRGGDRRYAPTPLLAQMVSAGTLGRKTGQGFYSYDDVDGAGPVAGLARSPAVRPGDATAAAPRRVGVVGSGTMAAGIAEVCARAGYPTVVVARTDVRAKAALTAVHRSLERAARRGKLAPDAIEASMARLTGAAQWEGLGDCDLVVEAVVEDLDVKRQQFRELDRVCRPGAVLATTTSSLPVIQCATATGRPEDVVGLHFFNPAPVMRLVELVRTVVTSEDTIGTAYTFCSALGKHAVECADRAGFIVNALLFPYLNQAVALLDDGYASADDIDRVMRDGWGYPMGPLRLLDVVGLDVSLAILRRLHEAFQEPALSPARCLEHLVQAGHLGRKTGQGFRNHGGQ